MKGDWFRLGKNAKKRKTENILRKSKYGIMP